VAKVCTDISRGTEEEGLFTFSGSWSRKSNILRTLTMKVTDYIQYGAKFFFQIRGSSLLDKLISD